MNSADPFHPPPESPSEGASLINLRAVDFVKQQSPDTLPSEVVRRAQEAGLELSILQVHRVRERERQRAARANPPEEPANAAAEAPDEEEPEEEPEEGESEEQDAKDSGEQEQASSEPTPRRRGRKPGGPDTKAGFVRSLPLDLPAKDVVAQAQHKGFEISEAYVSAIRSKLKAPDATSAPVQRRRRRKTQVMVTEAAVAEAPAVSPSPPAPTPVPVALPTPEPLIPRQEPVFSRERDTPVDAVEVEFATLVMEIGLLRAEQLMAQLKERVALLVRGRAGASQQG